MAKDYLDRTRKFDDLFPVDATQFEDKLKTYKDKDPAVCVFGKMSTDADVVLDLAAWKRVDEHCSSYACKQVSCLV